MAAGRILDDGQKGMVGVVVEAEEEDASASAYLKEDRVGGRKRLVMARACEEAYDGRKGEAVVAVEAAEAAEAEVAAPSWEAQVKPGHEQRV
jgi:hypothetical protein